MRRMKRVAKEYVSLCKDIRIEEIVDLAVFRPAAFLLVQLLRHFPVTPDQISACSIATGAASGLFFARGDRSGFFWAGILYGVTRVIDCTDGMIARLKKNGSAVGRIVDGTVDYVNAFLVFLGFLIGLWRSGIAAAFVLPVFVLVACSAFSLGLHSMIFDFYKSEFLVHALGVTKSLSEDRLVFQSELNRLKTQPGKWKEKIMIRLYLSYLSVQIPGGHRKKRLAADRYMKTNAPLLRLWSVIGSSSYILVLLVSALLYKPAIFFSYAIVFANLWMVLVWSLQLHVNRKNLQDDQEKQAGLAVSRRAN